ncbi:MAG TPA: hypothetical protein VNU46_02915, partial [Gemmatimonadaceae bacterium]|nr:hypothetical protein [Gemmatimonadaceae bacterium]
WDGRGMLSAEQDNTGCPVDDEFSKILNAAMLNLVGVNFSRPFDICPPPAGPLFFWERSPFMRLTFHTATTQISSPPTAVGEYVVKARRRWLVLSKQISRGTMTFETK